jgi:hypothetical protein
MINGIMYEGAEDGEDGERSPSPISLDVCNFLDYFFFCFGPFVICFSLSRVLKEWRNS